MTAVTVTASEPAYGINVGIASLRTHGPDRCANDPSCCIHNPSAHHMVDWPMHWRGDRGLMERICPHGIGHPDPDDIAYKVSIGRTSEGVHGCDGCCRE